MTITFRQVWDRPSVDIIFHADSGLPGANVSKTMEAKYPELIKPTITISNNGLRMTKEQAHQSLDSLNLTRGTYKTIALDYEFLNFTANTGQTQVSYTVSGIPDPFLVTTVYSFLPNTDVSFLLTELENHHSKSALVGVPLITATDITVQHRYTNDQDWNIKRWNDFRLARKIYSAGITRRETWQLVNSIST